MSLNYSDSDATYTSIDLNDTSTTSTIYDPSTDAEVSGVYMQNGGTSAEVQLEVTDGTDTSVLAVPGAGNSLEFGDTISLGDGDSLQINVTTAEGTAQANTAVVFKTE